MDVLSQIFEGNLGVPGQALALNFFKQRPAPLTPEELYFLLANHPLYCKEQKRGWPTLELTEWELEDLQDEVEGLVVSDGQEAFWEVDPSE